MTNYKNDSTLKVINYPDGVRFGAGSDIIMSAEVLAEHYITKEESDRRVLEAQRDLVRASKVFINPHGAEIVMFEAQDRDISKNEMLAILEGELLNGDTNKSLTVDKENT